MSSRPAHSLSPLHWRTIRCAVDLFVYEVPRTRVWLAAPCLLATSQRFRVCQSEDSTLLYGVVFRYEKHVREYPGAHMHSLAHAIIHSPIHSHVRTRAKTHFQTHTHKHMPTLAVACFNFSCASLSSLPAAPGGGRPRMVEPGLLTFSFEVCRLPCIPLPPPAWLCCVFWEEGVVIHNTCTYVIT